jgi:signal transduction histidine kinase
VLTVALAHQLRNRLGIIQTAIYNIKHKAADAPIGSSVEKIENSIRESSQIISNLADFARIEMPKRTCVSISDILDECMETAKAAFFEWSVDLTREDSDVRGHLLPIDSLQIKEVFDQLIRNAYQALVEKRGAVGIRARIDDVNDELTIRVSDNGAGIAPEDMAKIGKPFYSTKPGGIGLGLTTCYKIVELHGGHMEIHSALHEGTTVTISLPLK